MTSLRPRRQIIDRTFAVVYLVYLLGTAAFNREFARLHVELFGIPLFVGEAAIGTLLVLLLARGWAERKVPFPTDRLTFGLAAYLIIGCTFAVFGLLHGYGLAVFRDFALVYYLVFFLFTIAAVPGLIRPATVMDVLTTGSLVGSCVTIVSFFLAPRLVHEHAAPGYQALVAWIGAMWLALREGSRHSRALRALRYLGIGVNLLLIYLAAYRTMLPVMLITLAVLAGWAIMGRPGRQRTSLARAAAGLGLTV